MSRFDEYPFTRYLAAKKTVDDRALNKNVWHSLKTRLDRQYTSGPLTILEIGAGIGTMVERVLEWGLVQEAQYLALDSMPENIAEAMNRVPRFAREMGLAVEQTGTGELVVTGGGLNLGVSFRCADVFDFIADRDRKSSWDLMIANAVLDLLDVPSALPPLLSLIEPGGLFYFTINFDGATIFQPEIDPALDALIEGLYHRTMDERITKGKPSGDSRTGRHFFHRCREAGAQLLTAGSSDWVVHAGPEGYAGDEEFFLHFMIHTVQSALKDAPELDQRDLARWATERHEQIRQGTLVFIAHQMDFLGRVPT